MMTHRTKLARASGGEHASRLDQVRAAIPMRHDSIRTEEAHVGWLTRLILFHGKRHPLERGAEESTRWLSALAVQGR